MRLAAIDIGSNGIRILFQEVYETKKGPVFKKLSLLRLPVRLGEDAFKLGRISEANTHKLLKMARSFKHLKDVYDVVDYRAVATSAMRESENGQAIIDRIMQETGIHIHLADGTEEATILYDSIFSTGKMDPHESYMFVDVGGGSTEVNFYEGGERREWRSFNIGTIRLKEGIQDEDVWKDMEKWLSSVSKSRKTKYAVGTGGNINKVYKLCNLKNWEILKADTLKSKIEELEQYSEQELIEVIGLKSYRADVIVPGSMLYYKVMKAAGINKMIVPKVGVADGLIREMHLASKS